MEQTQDISPPLDVKALEQGDQGVADVVKVSKVIVELKYLKFFILVGDCPEFWVFAAKMKPALRVWAAQLNFVGIKRPNLV